MFRLYYHKTDRRFVKPEYSPVLEYSQSVRASDYSIIICRLTVGALDAYTTRNDHHTTKVSVFNSHLESGRTSPLLKLTGDQMIISRDSTVPVIVTAAVTVTVDT